MTDGFFICLLVLLSGWLLGNLFTWPLQHLFIFRPRKLPSDHAFDLPRKHEEYWLNTGGKGKINLWYLPAEGPAKGTILYFHGNASNLASWNDTQDFLAQQGYNMVAFDYRGYGKSTGPRRQEWMYRDAETVFEWVRQRFGAQKIILYGRSMGSTFATRVATLNRAHHLILETPFSSMKALFYSYYPFLPRLFFFAFPMPTVEYLQRVKIPVVIFQGTKDRIVPYRNARALMPALKSGDAFHRIEGGGHRDIATFQVYKTEMKKLLESS